MPDAGDASDLCFPVTDKVRTDNCHRGPTLETESWCDVRKGKKRLMVLALFCTAQLINPLQEETGQGLVTVCVCVSKVGGAQQVMPASGYMCDQVKAVSSSDDEFLTS